MEENKTVNTSQPAVVDTAKPVIDDPEAKIAALEAEKARLIEEGSNWKVAALKYKGKVKNDDEDDDGESDEDRIRRITQEELANSRIAQIAREQDEIIKKTLKENKELRAAQVNRNIAPTSMGSNIESREVQDTSVTPEQIAAFKARGWSEKDIERYKKNYRKYAGR